MQTQKQTIPTVKATRNNIPVTATVSPCSWMYPNYPLTVRFTTPSSGSLTMTYDSKRLPDATEKFLEAEIAKISFQPCKCSGCPNLAFHPSLTTNRDGKCESCFTAELDAEFAQLFAEDLKETEKFREQARKTGATHIVEAWVHPKRGGDDYLEMIAFTGQTVRQACSEHPPGEEQCNHRLQGYRSLGFEPHDFTTPVKF